MSDTAVMPSVFAYLDGKQAGLEGKSYTDNPYARGFTKLGALKPSDKTRAAFEAWEEGRTSIGRHATAQEVADALKYDPSQFKRKANKFYAGSRS